MKKKRITVTLDEWCIEEINRLLKSDFYKDRGCRMTRSYVIMEAIANFTPIKERW